MFHSPGWLEALNRTYGFRPAVLTTSPPGSSLKNGLVFCRVRSWLAGRRLISLPFSDHCEPLVGDADERECLLEGLRQEAGIGNCKSTEFRPLSSLPVAPSGFRSGQSFCFHRLDLTPGAEEVFGRFHKDCVKRKIRRAEREHVVVDSGRSSGILDEFYRLMILTRRRHGLPPQPLAWFRNLIDCLGDSLAIWVARKDGQPLAAILTCRHGRTLTYKYGASDARYHQLGTMPCLFWAAIQDGIGQRFESLDLGRSDEDNPGLLAFKDHLGATRSTLTYWTSPAQPAQPASSATWKRGLMRQVCTHIPQRCLPALGALLYRHVA